VTRAKFVARLKHEHHFGKHRVVINYRQADLTDHLVVYMSNRSRTSLMERCRAYLAHGLTGLIDRWAGGNSAKLRSV